MLLYVLLSILEEIKNIYLSIYLYLFTSLRAIENCLFCMPIFVTTRVTQKMIYFVIICLQTVDVPVEMKMKIRRIIFLNVKILTI